MKIEIVPCLSDNYSYLIFEKESNTVCIVDPSDYFACDKFIKKYKKLDYILNTHHHSDHVDGNLRLKEKYNSKIIGSFYDKDRIPGIDMFLKKNQVLKIGNLELKVLFVPGHTSGHIAFYFFKQEVVFTGDTLFSLGCGRVLEGTHDEMFNSLNNLKKLPLNTKIYCGHEYTKSNLDFCLKYDPENVDLKNKAEAIYSKIKNNKSTLPSTIGEEIKTNIFLRCDNLDIKKKLNSLMSSDLEIFTKLRDLKDTF